MKIRYFFTVVVAAALFATAASGFLDFKTGYTKTLGELGDRYGGGFFLGIGIKIPLPGPVSLVPHGTYASLGQDAQFDKIMEEYLVELFPEGIPAEIEEYGDIESSLYTAGVGVRFHILDSFLLGIHVEPGFTYVHRELSAMGVPLSVLENYIPGFNLPVEGDDGYGFYAEGGGSLLNKIPIISIKFGVRYLMAFNLGRTSVDEFMEENSPDFQAPKDKHLKMLIIYGGFGLF